MLTKEAFNALLKTLEEPPPNVIFIFATTEVHKVPATILSRCQRFDFRRIGIDQIMGNLRVIAAQEEITIDDNALLLVARKGDGSLRDAQSIFDQAVSLCGRSIAHAQILEALNVVDQEVYFRITNLIKTKDARGALTLVDELVTSGHDLREFLSGLLEHFRNFLVVQTTGSAANVETSDIYRQRYLEEARSFTTSDLLRYQRFVTGTESALRYTSQPRFKLEADMVHLVLLPGAADVGDLLTRLDDLKKKAAEVAVDAPVPSAGRPAPVRVPPPRPAVPPAVTTPPPVQAPHPERTVSEPEVRSRWEEYLSVVKKQRISLASVLESTSLLGLSGNTVRIGCMNEYQTGAIFRNREFLLSVFQQVFHVPARIEAEVHEQSGTGTHTPAGRQTPEHHEPENPILEVFRRELGAEQLGEEP
jgi:DNA polymerase-3 subunit gamma/tau